MASHQDFVDYVAEQLRESGSIRSRKMFGEYGLYCDDIFFAVICDDQLFIKVTPAGEAAFPNLSKVPPYAGANDYIWVEDVDDRDTMTALTRLTCQALHGLLDKRQALSDQIEQMEQEKTAIEQQVKLKMQDAAYGTAPGYKVSWVCSESKRVDSQRLRKEQPDIFSQYSKNVSSRRFTIVHAA